MQSSLCKEDLIVTNDQDNGILFFIWNYFSLQRKRYRIKSVNFVINESSVKLHLIGSAVTENDTTFVQFYRLHKQKTTLPIISCIPCGPFGMKSCALHLNKTCELLRKIYLLTEHLPKIKFTLQVVDTHLLYNSCC